MWRASLTPISALIGQSVSCSCRGTTAAVPSRVYKHVQHPVLPQYVTCLALVTAVRCSLSAISHLIVLTVITSLCLTASH